MITASRLYTGQNDLLGPVFRVFILLYLPYLVLGYAGEISIVKGDYWITLGAVVVLPVYAFYLIDLAADAYAYKARQWDEFSRLVAKEVKFQAKLIRALR